MSMMWTLRWLLLWVTLALAMDDYRMGDSVHKIVLDANIRNPCLPTALGVNFGFKYITAAYYTASNESITVAKLEAPADYQKHMESLVTDSQKRVVRFQKVFLREGDGLIPAPKEYQGYSKNDSMILSDTLRHMTGAANHTLGRPVRISAVSLPSDLDTISRDHVLTALTGTDVAPELTHPGQLLGFLNAARLAYSLDTPESLGYPPDFDLMHGPLNIAVYIDYNGYSLDLWTADLTELGVDTLEHEHSYARYPDLGLWRVDPADSESRVSQVIHNFISNLKKTDDAQHVRAVIVSGEAPLPAMNSLRSIVSQALPMEWIPMLRDQLDPAYVAAIGSAHRARKFIQNPEIWADDYDHPHDEL
ncbi:hypothetical protein N7505_000218 [Penicillium chrysogenum]|uniref:Uncharacterized protein n=1 Tax=Penicillium chrysogenum TaxID=5076 RepID=A0ABQ8WT76_PENCH|nr:hypothetical protein N7505_000218 [Penicillium chrysogenum]